jgi:hypothetical protein
VKNNEVIEADRQVVPLGWRTFANGDLYLDVLGARYTVRRSPHGYLLRSNGALIATFDTVEARRRSAR